MAIDLVRLSPKELNDPINLTPDLVKIPGFVAMSEQRREWLRNETALALGDGRAAAMHTVMFCIRIARIDEGLKNEPVSFANWAETMFGQARQTAQRALENFREMRKLASEEAIMDLAKYGLPGMQGMQVGRIVTAMKKLPPPVDPENPKKMEEWRVRLTEQLRMTFRDARVGREETIDPQDAMKKWASYTKLMIKKTGIDSSPDVIAWLEEGLGYVMDSRAISGNLTASRKPAPAGFWKKRGRPKGSKKKQKTTYQEQVQAQNLEEDYY